MGGAEGAIPDIIQLPHVCCNDEDIRDCLASIDPCSVCRTYASIWTLVGAAGGLPHNVGAYWSAQVSAIHLRYLRRTAPCPRELGAACLAAGGSRSTQRPVLH